MAARLLLQRRISSIFAQYQRHTSLLKEPSWQFLSSPSLRFGIEGHSQVKMDKRWNQTQTEPTTKGDEGVDEHEPCGLDPATLSAKMLSHPVSDGSSAVKYTAMSNLKTSTRHDLVMIFTCKVCETRSVKTVCRESYEKGVVVARCGGCTNLHLIADRLGWFGEPGSVEDLLASRGEEVKKGSLDTLNLTLEDLAGYEAGSRNS
ncbi:hypothetical protein HHK36_011183 [Tetracentron sinense]|uniref:DNL-type domain-containing protein n=1 Tax=Tetracentron sinense TaxID=13715 RepID=A0A834Z7L1_TETSI|nr:hypothetical protein HHK36_011183 [Tetracentron sinense]